MTKQNEAIRLAIEALQSAKEEYWDDHHSDMSEGDFENHWLVMDICKAMKALRPLLDQPADSFVAAGEWAIVPKRLTRPMAQAVEDNIDGEGNLYDCWYSMMLNAAPQPPGEYLAGRWLPVDTAPKQDGERVLLALIEDERWLWVTIGWWDKKRKAWWHNPDGRLIPPSHWMPLPAPRPDIVRPGPDSCATVAADKGYPYQDHMEAFEKRIDAEADKQRCNHCMTVQDEANTECEKCGKDDALMYPFDPIPADKDDRLEASVALKRLHYIAIAAAKNNHAVDSINKDFDDINRALSGSDGRE